MLDEKRKNLDQGQIVMEFTFTMIIALIMMFSVIMVFRWAGYDFGWRRVDHDLKLQMNVIEDYVAVCAFGGAPPCDLEQGPIEQLDPYFHEPEKMKSAWGL